MEQGTGKGLCSLASAHHTFSKFWESRFPFLILVPSRKSKESLPFVLGLEYSQSITCIKLWLQGKGRAVLSSIKVSVDGRGIVHVVIYVQVNSVHDAGTRCAVAYSEIVVVKNKWTSRSWVATDNKIMTIPKHDKHDSIFQVIFISFPEIHKAIHFYPF